MAIGVDASSPARVTSSSAALTITSASFTPPANTVLVACLSGNDDGTGTIAAAFSSSPALTWTLGPIRGLNAGDVGAQNGVAVMATAVVTTSQAYTVTGSISGSAAIGPVSLKPYVVTGADTSSPVGATGEGSSTTNAISPTVYTSTVAGSRAFGAATDWQALGVPTSTDTADGFTVAGQISGMSVFKAAATAVSGSAVTLNFDAAGTGTPAWNWVAVEIKPAATGGASIAPDGISVPVTLGSPTLSDGSLSIAPTGISAPVALGAPTLADGSMSVAPAGVPVPVALGDPTLTWSATVAPDGIAVPVVLGDPTVGASSVNPDGIAVPVTLGDPALSWTGSIAPDGIAVPVALGAPIVGAVAVNPDGISVPVVLGDPALSWSATAAPDGIGVPVVLGSPTLTLSGIAPDGVSVPVALGSPVLTWSGTVSPDGISVPVSLGAPDVNMPGTRIIRPNIGTTSRPATGTIARPTAGTATRPSTGTITRPNAGIVTRP